MNEEERTKWQKVGQEMFYGEKWRRGFRAAQDEIRSQLEYALEKETRARVSTKKEGLLEALRIIKGQ